MFLDHLVHFTFHFNLNRCLKSFQEKSLFIIRILKPHTHSRANLVLPILLLIDWLLVCVIILSANSSADATGDF